jgi:signal transduction histidine kinase
VLDFGRIEAGAHLYRIEKQDCASLTRRVVDEFQPEAQGADHNVIFHSDGSAEIDVDAESFSRALRNLLENAVKYSPGGRVVDVTQTCAGGHARIAVRDRGIGVPRHERTKIFARFQRGDEARLRGIRGTGIGLAMVDEIVKAHRGRVELESPSDGGSIFTIVLPLNGGQES